MSVPFHVHAVISTIVEMYPLSKAKVKSIVAIYGTVNVAYLFRLKKFHFLFKNGHYAFYKCSTCIKKNQHVLKNV
jgi:hypothetical protein